MIVGPGAGDNEVIAPTVTDVPRRAQQLQAPIRHRRPNTIQPMAYSAVQDTVVRIVHHSQTQLEGVVQLGEPPGFLQRK